MAEDVKEESKNEIEDTEEVLDDEAPEDEEVKETDEQLEEDESLPFPMATVVRQVKKRTHSKMISSKVKVAMNEFLGPPALPIRAHRGLTPPVRRII